MRRTVRCIGWIGLACTVAVVAIVAGVCVTHPRDEPGYLDYVRTYGDYHGRHLSESTPTEPLLEAGDRACNWLSHQPPALWRTGSHYRIPALSRAYWSTMPDADRALPSAMLAGAWAYLCPATTLLVRPHYVFTGPSSD